MTMMIVAGLNSSVLLCVLFSSDAALEITGKKTYIISMARVHALIYTVLC